MVKSKRLYAAIRHSNDGHDYIDTDSIGADVQAVKDAVAAVDALIPSWADDNKIVRIVMVEISEVEEGKPVKPAMPTKRGKSKGPIMIDSLDCTDVIREMERNQTRPACPKKWLDSRMDRADVRRDSEKTQATIRAGLDDVLRTGEPLVVKTMDGDIIVRRRAM